jgi:hypothetical protein
MATIAHINNDTQLTDVAGIDAYVTGLPTIVLSTGC